jgi:oligosaccharyltransferase complex subunit gamma
LTIASRSGFDPQPLAEQLSSYTPVPIPYKEPIDWFYWGTLVFGGVLFSIALPFMLPILLNRWTWAAVTIITALVMTSGFMFTRIRGVPYIGSNGEWISGGYQNQFGQEVQIIASICKLIH